MKSTLQPIDEAYKLVSGDPSMTAVSDAAKGQKPLSDEEQRMENFQQDEKCVDINEAYAMLFGALSMIMRSQSDHAEDAQEGEQDD